MMSQITMELQFCVKLRYEFFQTVIQNKQLSMKKANGLKGREEAIFLKQIATLLLSER